MKVDKHSKLYCFLRKIYRYFRKIYYGVQASCKKEPLVSLETHEDTFHIDFQKRTKVLDEFRYLALKNNLPSSGTTIADNYFNLALDEHAILMVGLGNNVRGNLQYILNELNSSDKFADFHIYVRTSPETDEIVKDYIHQNNWGRTSTVSGDKPYRKLMESCKYLITEVYMPEAWVKKPGQLYINIWHGTPLKKLGLAKNTKNSHRNGTTQKNFIDADYLTYPNQYTMDHMLEAYKVSQLMPGKTVLLGYPRTGGMLAASQSGSDTIRKQLAPNGEKLYAYMPTFRDYLSDEQSIKEIKDFLDFLDNNFSEDQLLYVNLHHRLNTSVNYNNYKHIRPFPPTIDSYKLLAETEALISDYSSVFFDYLILRKQIILFIPDYEKYCKIRGLFMDLYDLPFDKAKTKEEVLNFINLGKTYDDTKAFETFCSYDSIENAKKLCQLFFRDEQNLKLNPIPHDNRKRILIYSDACQQDDSTDFLSKFLEKYNHEQYDIFLGCDMDLVDMNKKSAYPMMFENPVIGSETDPHLTTLGQSIKKLYLSQTIPFEKAINYLKYDYALIPKRMYGQAVFDCVIIYDAINPEKIIAHTEMDTIKLLFLHSNVLSKVQSGDLFLRDSIRYAAKYSKNIMVSSVQDKLLCEKLLGDYWKNKVQVVETTDDFSQIINITLKEVVL